VKWQRAKRIDDLAFEVARGPMSAWVWMLLLVAMAAVAMVKPTFAFCALVEPSGQRHALFSLGSLVSDWGVARVGVGGPGQQVVVCDDPVQPVSLAAGWFGRYVVEAPSGDQPLSPGSTVRAGPKALRFIRFVDPGSERAPSEPPRPGPEEDLSKIA
jgi:hypothetical protein